MKNTISKRFAKQIQRIATEKAMEVIHIPISGRSEAYYNMRFYRAQRCILEFCIWLNVWKNLSI